jgi:6-pyruvoyltetrahydropterin/6-carboxytetrahydropterin synthase
VSTTIVKTIHFEAAHRLPNTPEGHKCRTMHGHSYACELHVTGPVEPRTGWIQDFGELKAAFQPLLETLDHHVLNEVPGLENPTAENICRWIWERLRPRLPLLSAVVVHETPTSRCVYTGP